MSGIVTIASFAPTASAFSATITISAYATTSTAVARGT
jgi:hypothetical protein